MGGDRPRRAVLAVGADDEAYASLARAAQRSGAAWDLRRASDGEAAAALLRGGWAPDLALIDATDGDAALERVREASRATGVAALVVADVDADRAFAAGAAKVLVAPRDDTGWDAVVRRLTRLLGALDAQPSSPPADVRPDLGLVALAKRCLCRGSAMRRGDFARTIADHARCDVIAAQRLLDDLVARGYVEQVGSGDVADVYPGHNLSSAVIRAFSPPPPEARC